MLLEIWKKTREPYFLCRAVDTIQSSSQFIARFDGDFGGKAGMLPEGVDHYEGRVHRTSHVSPMGWVTCANLCCREQFGGIIVHFYNYVAGAVEFLDLKRVEGKNSGMEVMVLNPWDEDISTTVGIYFSDTKLSLKQDGKELSVSHSGPKAQAEIEIPAKGRTLIEILSCER